MQPETAAQSVQQSANGEFRPGVLGDDPRHDL
jgi:hypothetical protein